MFDHYGNKYDVTLIVNTANDNAKDVYSTHMVVYSTYVIRCFEEREVHFVERGGSGQATGVITTRQSVGDRHSNNVTMTVGVRTIGGYSRGDPIIEEMTKLLKRAFGWSNKRSDRYSVPDEFKLAIVLPHHGNMAVMIERGATYYKLMNQRIQKKNLMFALSRYLYRSCFDKDGVSILTYLMKMMALPENITYVLENRVPFWFFDIQTRTKIHCRLNVRLISNDEVALEISDGIWGTLTVHDLDVMVNYFYHGHTRAKSWQNTSPKKLWTRVMSEAPTKAQLELMQEFLVQNRTKDLIENRALVLMNGLVEKYPDRINIIDYTHARGQEYRIMLVAGKLADWVIVNTPRTSDTQKVRVFVWDNTFPRDNDTDRELNDNEEIWMKQGGKFNGSICIDNIHSNSSLGDQYAARALALLNDHVTVKLVNTIEKYIPEQARLRRVESRFLLPVAEMDAQSLNWGQIL
tara:strand:- start:1737 stop:3125 length:1389 start_codon:yes stop_codon:yes gene_type:complete